jgi:hypothetical protein
MADPAIQRSSSPRARGTLRSDPTLLGGGSNDTGAWDDVSATIEVIGEAPVVRARRLLIVGMAM